MQRHKIQILKIQQRQKKYKVDITAKDVVFKADSLLATMEKYIHMAQKEISYGGSMGNSSNAPGGSSGGGSINIFY